VREWEPIPAPVNQPVFRIAAAGFARARITAAVRTTAPRAKGLTPPMPMERRERLRSAPAPRSRAAWAGFRSAAVLVRRRLPLAITSVTSVIRAVVAVASPSMAVSNAIPCRTATSIFTRVITASMVVPTVSIRDTARPVTFRGGDPSCTRPPRCSRAGVGARSRNRL
jgi:hypothetical protein